jgi:hypothetical protein
VLVGAVAVHSTDVQVVGGIGRVKNTRWAGHNKGRVLAQGVATFPVDTGMKEREGGGREREKGREGGSRIMFVSGVYIFIHDMMIGAKVYISVHLLKLFMIVYHTL